jgi:hypothetical protein
VEDLTDDEQDGLVAYVKKMEAELLAQLEKDVGRRAGGLLEEFRANLNNIVQFSEQMEVVNEERVMDMVMDEDASFVVREWDEHNTRSRSDIDIRIGDTYREYHELPNFHLKRGGKYRVVVIVRKIGEVEIPDSGVGLEFVGGH